MIVIGIFHIGYQVDQNKSGMVMMLHINPILYMRWA